MTFNIFGNTTDTVSWTPNPTARGTSNILQSCLLTMSLCVWTAVHLNIQERDNPRFAGLSYQTWRKIGWLILGLLAPEMLVYTAWSQREEAKRSMDAYNEAFGCTTTPGLFSKGGKCGRIFRKGLHMLKRKTSNPNGQEPQPETEKPQGWTMTQGFYAQMGGFVLDTTGDHLDQSIREDLRNSLPGARTTLSVHYFCNLMRYEFTTKDWIIADALKISRQDISDKSKASGLAKTLVCFQALWFCIQCFARVSQNLPITLLELNSFAHSACALLVYILWWEKPLDVEQSTSLPVSDMQTIRIWARMNESRCFKCLGKEPRTLQNILSNRLYSFLGLPTQTLSTSSSLHGQTVPLSPVDTPEDTPFNLPRFRASSPDGQSYEGIFQLFPPTMDVGVWWPLPSEGLESTEGDRLDVLQRLHGSLYKNYVNGEISWQAYLALCDHSHINGSIRAKNWPEIDFKRPWIQLLFLTVAFLYGGLHALAWNSVFPSYTQQLLWRISASVIMGAGFLMLSMFHLSGDDSFDVDDLDDLEGHFRRTHIAPRWTKYLYLVAMPLLKNAPKSRLTMLKNIQSMLNGMLRRTAVALLLPYILARLYLVVECFIQLFHLPPGPVFYQPVWATYIPHIG